MGTVVPVASADFHFSQKYFGKGHFSLNVLVSERFGLGTFLSRNISDTEHTGMYVTGTVMFQY